MQNIYFLSENINWFVFVFCYEKIHVKDHLKNISNLTNVCYDHYEDYTKLLSANYDILFLKITGHDYWKRKHAWVSFEKFRP